MVCLFMVCLFVFLFVCFCVCLFVDLFICLFARFFLNKLQLNSYKNYIH